MHEDFYYFIMPILVKEIDLFLWPSSRRGVAIFSHPESVLKKKSKLAVPGKSPGSEIFC